MLESQHCPEAVHYEGEVEMEEKNSEDRKGAPFRSNHHQKGFQTSVLTLSRPIIHEVLDGRNRLSHPFIKSSARGFFNFPAGDNCTQSLKWPTGNKKLHMMEDYSFRRQQSVWPLIRAESFLPSQKFQNHSAINAKTLSTGGKHNIAKYLTERSLGKP